MATPRKIVCVEYTLEKAQEMAGYCRAAGNTRDLDRHPRIHRRVIRAEKVAVEVFVVVADAIPACPIRSSLGETCAKDAGHKGRCNRGNVFWGEGKPEATVED